MEPRLALDRENRRSDIKVGRGKSTGPECSGLLTSAAPRGAPWKLSFRSSPVISDRLSLAGWRAWESPSPVHSCYVRGCRKNWMAGILLDECWGSRIARGLFKFRIKTRGRGSTLQLRNFLYEFIGDRQVGFVDNGIIIKGLNSIPGKCSEEPCRW
ncbi:hypothetical protein AVEN_238897-1 [Araneus ventricosus]|uniref:Uncharacterized protein n=1 Tax=Araneus ventricosus TaxID=182803 RepID=A0A4Y2X0Q7_ARAVE|nr:hypothetical protein AVEN_238897-1 [Araneus ventricosus]